MNLSKGVQDRNVSSEKRQKDDDIVQEKSVLSLVLKEELADSQVTLASGQDKADGSEDKFQSPCVTRSLNERSTAKNTVITELGLQPQDERTEVDMAATPVPGKFVTGDSAHLNGDSAHHS